MVEVIDYYRFLLSLEMDIIDSPKLIFMKIPLKSHEEILSEHRKLNKILKTSLKLSKRNKKFLNFHR